MFYTKNVKNPERDHYVESQNTTILLALYFCMNIVRTPITERSQTVESVGSKRFSASRVGGVSGARPHSQVPSRLLRVLVN